MLTLLMAFSISAFAQTEPKVLSYENPKVRIDNKEYVLDYIDDWGYATIVFKRYDSNGNLLEQGKYHAGKPDGKWFSYDQNGKLLAEAVYNKGKRVKMTSHSHKDGRVYTVIYKDRFAIMDPKTDGDRVAQVIISGF